MEYITDMSVIYMVYTWYIIVYYACILHPVAGVAEEGRVPFPRIHQLLHRLDES